MIIVTEETKKAYSSSSIKHLTVTFPELDLTLRDNKIIYESISLEEGIEEKECLTFTGCLSSQLSFQCMGITLDLRGRYVEAVIIADSTDPISLFHGYVESQKIMDYYYGKCEIVAYDILYSKGQTDIAAWYKSLSFPISVKDYRDSLFSYLGIDVREAALVNDHIVFDKQYSPASMKALDSIRAICQINGVFGIVNRNGEFEFRSIEPIDTEGTYDEVEFYKKLDYQRYTVQAIGRVIVRQSSSDEGASYGDGGNIYVVQGNMFTLNLEEELLSEIAENIYQKVQGITYTPYTGVSYSMPWIESGDIVKYRIYDPSSGTYFTAFVYVFSRYIKGIQVLMDTFKAEGNEFQNVFISDLSVQITTIQNQIEAIQGKLESIQLKFLMFYNMSAVDIGDGATVAVANTRFAVSQSGQVYFEMEYLIECSTTEIIENNVIVNNDLQVSVLFEYDGEIIDIRKPKETYQDGEHILHCYYVLNVDNTTTHTWKIWLNCVGGSVHINILEAQNTILGLNIVGNTAWDGTIDVDDTMNAVPLTIALVSEILDTVVISLTNPVLINGNESIDGIEVLRTDVAGITENIEIEETEEN